MREWRPRRCQGARRCSGSARGSPEGATRLRSKILHSAAQRSTAQAAYHRLTPSPPPHRTQEHAPCSQPAAHLTKGSLPATQNWVVPGRQCTLLSSSRPRWVRQASRRRLAAAGWRRSKCRTSPSAAGQGRASRAARRSAATYAGMLRPAEHATTHGGWRASSRIDAWRAAG